MASDEEKLEALNEIARNRGYVLDYHGLMVEYDLEALQAVDQLARTVYKQQRLLDEKTKELPFALSMTCLRVSRGQIAAHVKLAIDAGATPQEVLEAIELAIPEAGIPTFMHGLLAWAEAVGAEGLQPTVDAYDGGETAT